MTEIAADMGGVEMPVRVPIDDVLAPALPETGFPGDTATVEPSDPVLARWQALRERKLHPVKEGLTESLGVLPKVHLSMRVAGWAPEGVEEQAVVRLKTMGDLTEKGTEFMAQLQALNDIGLKDIPRKERQDWRIANRFLRLMRLTSADHLTELMYNVLGVDALQVNSPAPSDLMRLKVVAGARPVLAEEIVFSGDNSNDHYGQALEKLTAELGYDSAETVHWHLGQLYAPGMFTEATAQGCRQLNSPEAWVTWGKSIIRFAEIERLPAAQMRRAKRQIAVRSIRQVLRAEDAA